MQRKWFLVFGIVLMLVGVGGFLLRSKLKPAQAGVLIESNPQAGVFIDGEQVGTTPYDAVRKPGEITLKLVPASGSSIPWDTKITLIEGIKTVVRRDFGESDSLSSGEVLSFEKITGELASMAIVSNPGSAQVMVDGEVRGYTPLPVDALTEGYHKILISRSGYKDREISAKAIPGYKLTVFSTLAQEDSPSEASQSAETSDSTNSNSQVEILDTPTGFLRVRKEPSTAASESGKVKPQEKYTLLEESKDGKWYKIEFTDGEEGWISSQYAKKLDSSSEEKDQ